MCTTPVPSAISSKVQGTFDSVEDSVALALPERPSWTGFRKEPGLEGIGVSVPSSSPSALRVAMLAATALNALTRLEVIDPAHPSGLCSCPSTMGTSFTSGDPSETQLSLTGLLTRRKRSATDRGGGGGAGA